MRLSISVFVTSIFLLLSLASISQTNEFLDFMKPEPNYNDCAAILIDGKVLDKDYFIENKPKLMKGMTGVLTVATVSYSNNGTVPKKNIQFQVAIKNGRTNTIFVYTREAVSELSMDELLRKCENGDRIILMPVEQKYSLSQHELAVAAGC